MPVGTGFLFWIVAQGNGWAGWSGIRAESFRQILCGIPAEQPVFLEPLRIHSDSVIANSVPSQQARDIHYFSRLKAPGSRNSYEFRLVHPTFIHTYISGFVRRIGSRHENKFWAGGVGLPVRPEQLGVGSAHVVRVHCDGIDGASLDEIVMRDSSHGPSQCPAHFDHANPAESARVERV